MLRIRYFYYVPVCKNVSCNDARHFLHSLPPMAARTGWEEGQARGSELSEDGGECCKKMMDTFLALLG